MKKILSELSQHDKAVQSAAVQEQLFSDPAYKSAQNLALYLNMQDEIKTFNILKDAFHQGKNCFIPRYFSDAGRDMQIVRLMDINDYDNLPLTKWNIKQPAENEDREEANPEILDLIVIPGLAFTVEGLRLGRGKGFYDRYLSKCGPKTEKIALAFKEQIVKEIPVDESDIKVDKVLFLR